MPNRKQRASEVYGQRIDALLERLGMNPTECAAFFQIDPAVFLQWKQGKFKRGSLGRRYLDIIERDPFAVGNLLRLIPGANPRALVEGRPYFEECAAYGHA